jgi:hypothetical protein
MRNWKASRERGFFVAEKLVLKKNVVGDNTNNGKG